MEKKTGPVHWKVFILTKKRQEIAHNRKGMYGDCTPLYKRKETNTKAVTTTLYDGCHDMLGYRMLIK
jgi:hypothetical protein